MNNKINSLEIFLMNEQPFTCPHCGTRCEEIGNFCHTNAKFLIEQCLNKNCGLCAERKKMKITLNCGR